MLAPVVKLSCFAIYILLGLQVYYYFFWLMFCNFNIFLLGFTLEIEI